MFAKSLMAAKNGRPTMRAVGRPFLAALSQRSASGVCLKVRFVMVAKTFMAAKNGRPTINQLPTIIFPRSALTPI